MVALGVGGQAAHQAQARAVLVVAAVREVEAHHVDAGAQQPPQHRSVVGRRTEGGDDLGAALGRFDK